MVHLLGMEEKYDYIQYIFSFKQQFAFALRVRMQFFCIIKNTVKRQLSVFLESAQLDCQGQQMPLIGFQSRAQDDIVIIPVPILIIQHMQYLAFFIPHKTMNNLVNL